MIITSVSFMAQPASEAYRSKTGALRVTQ